MAARKTAVWLWVLAWTTFVPLGIASDPPDAETESASQVDDTMASATVERIMEAAVRNIAIRYNLNNAQTRLTDELMKREVRGFIKEHENEVWPVIRGLLAAQYGAALPSDPEAVKRLGQVARPLARKAWDAIFRANEEWGKCLTADQKRLHDFDMAEMGKAFDRMDGNFESWGSGDATGGSIFPPPPPPGSAPPLPSRPEGPRLPTPIKRFITVTVLDTLVEEFIKDYDLDDGQITAAGSILVEFKGKATDFIAAKKEEFAKINAVREKARAERDTEGIKSATAAHKALLAPFYELAAKMRERLDGLLTSTQIERHADQRKRPDSPKATATISESEPQTKTAGGEKDGAKRPEAPPKTGKD